MGIKESITRITGGGYHGKSTLMQAILAGVYAHLPGDGREFVWFLMKMLFLSGLKKDAVFGTLISVLLSGTCRMVLKQIIFTR
jgi:predicted ABC-class ATPase